LSKIFVPTKTRRIFIVDDDEAIRDSMRVLLESVGFSEVTTFGSARDFLESARPRSGDCLLVDVHMPDMGGLELQAELAARGSGVAVIVMTGHGEVPIAVRAMKAGAIDFLEKPIAEDLLLDCVRRGLALGAARARQAEEIDETDRRLQSLTPREREVLEGMVQGRPNKVIAHDLGISPRTVEIHRARVMEKMEARSLSALIRMALAAGIGHGAA
jgi:two-component system, LuxR family, response regulator FixJ